MREVASLPFELSNSFDILPCCKKKREDNVNSKLERGGRER